MAAETGTDFQALLAHAAADESKRDVTLPDGTKVHLIPPRILPGDIGEGGEMVGIGANTKWQFTADDPDHPGDKDKYLLGEIDPQTGEITKVWQKEGQKGSTFSHIISGLKPLAIMAVAAVAGNVALGALSGTGAATSGATAAGGSAGTVSGVSEALTGLDAGLAGTGGSGALEAGASNLFSSGVDYVSKAISNAGTSISNFLDSTAELFTGTGGAESLGGDAMGLTGADSAGFLADAATATTGTAGKKGLIDTVLGEIKGMKTSDLLALGLTGASVVGGASAAARAKETADANREQAAEDARLDRESRERMPAITKEANMLKGNVATVPLSPGPKGPLLRPDGTPIWNENGLLNAAMFRR